MELLYAVAGLTGLPVQAVVDDFLRVAEELGVDTENLQLEDIQYVLSHKVDLSLPILQEQLNQATIN